ncbi:prepilin-type N-terminal cleavage/methylation domain-containing protein [bacterium]|nr:prepilin-type N-terminal cleavage/methylation domain-containing protein [bacterium]
MWRKGFSLVELLIALAIMGVMSGIIFPSFIMIQNKAKESAVTAIMLSTQLAIESYYLGVGSYPEGSGIELPELIAQLSDKQIMSTVPKNPYTGSPYQSGDGGRIAYDYDKDTGVYTLEGFEASNQTLIQSLSNQ